MSDNGNCSPTNRRIGQYWQRARSDSCAAAQSARHQRERPGRSFRIPIRCFDQAVVRTAAFLRFPRHPKIPSRAAKRDHTQALHPARLCHRIHSHNSKSANWAAMFSPRRYPRVLPSEHSISLSPTIG